MEQLATVTPLKRRHAPHIRRHRRPVVQTTPCEPVVIYDHPLPHAVVLLGGFLLTLVAGVMLGVGITISMG